MPFDSLMQIIWLVLLVVFAASEAATVGLTSIWFAAGSLAALIAALLGGPLWVQLTLFFAVSLLCLAAVRPLAKRLLNSRVEPTNADRVIGAEAQVTEDVDNIHGKGAGTAGPSPRAPWSGCCASRGSRCLWSPCPRRFPRESPRRGEEEAVFQKKRFILRRKFYENIRTGRSH